MKGKLLKILSLLTCLALSVGFTSCGASGDNDSNNSLFLNESSEIGESESSEECSEESEEILVGTEGLTYQLVSGGKYAIVTGYDGATTEIVIASRYQGVPVRYINTACFNGRSDLTRVVIPDSVTYIGQNAFGNCDKLTEVVMGKNVAQIGNYAFQYCGRLTEIIIPDSVTNIGSYTFKNCDRLTEIIIPNSIISIVDNAFSGCDNLQCTVKDGLKYLGNKDNPYVYLDGVETRDIKSAAIENGCKMIGGSAFFNCENLTEVVIPDSVTSIGYLPFAACSSLQYNEKNGLQYLGNEDNEYLYLMGVKESLASISVENGCKVIASNALSFCRNTTEIIIPDSVVNIGSRAFYGCSSVTEIVIPAGVTSVGEYAFSDCTSLRNITVDENNTQYKDVDGNLYSKDGERFIAYAVGKKDKSFAFPDGIVEFSIDQLLKSSSVTELFIPDSAVLFNSNIAGGPPSFLSILTAPAIVATQINRYADITQLTVTSGEIIGQINTKELVISDKVMYIEEGAINKVSNITVSEANPKYQSINGDLYTKDGKTLLRYSMKDTDGIVTLPDGVTRISVGAFRFCTKLTEVVIPASVTSIGHYAFYECDCLTTVTFGENSQLASIGEGAFISCRNLTKIIIPASVTSVGAGALNGGNRLIIYCEVDSLPSGWNDEWNGFERPVVWGYKGE